MSKDDTLIAELLIARFSHDMAGPVGALNNGVEFLQEADPEMVEQAKGLLELSAQEAKAKLQLFRMAYGVMKPGTLGDVTEMKELVEGYFAHSKLNLAWDLQDGALPTAEHMRVIANMVLCASTMLMMGGVLTVSAINSGTQLEYMISGEGPRVKVEDDLEELLKVEPSVDELNPRLIQPYVMVRQLRDITASERFALYHSESNVSLRVYIPLTD